MPPTPYQVESNGVKKKLRISLRVEGTLQQKTGPRLICLEKTYSFSRRTIRVHYRIINIDQDDLHTIFSPEINLSFISARVKDLRIYQNLSRNMRAEIDFSPLELEPQSGIVFEDQFNRVRLELDFSPETECWILPLETQHLEWNHWRQTYQASTLLPRWRLDLKPAEEHICELTLNLTSIRSTRKY